MVFCSCTSAFCAESTLYFAATKPKRCRFRVERLRLRTCVLRSHLDILQLQTCILRSRLKILQPETFILPINFTFCCCNNGREFCSGKVNSVETKLDAVFGGHSHNSSLEPKTFSLQSASTQPQKRKKKRRRKKKRSAFSATILTFAAAKNELHSAGAKKQQQQNNNNNNNKKRKFAMVTLYSVVYSDKISTNKSFIDG